MIKQLSISGQIRQDIVINTPNYYRVKRISQTFSYLTIHFGRGDGWRICCRHRRFWGGVGNTTRVRWRLDK